jgi:PAS domain S-box-containing protein
MFIKKFFSFCKIDLAPKESQDSGPLDNCNFCISNKAINSKLFLEKIINTAPIPIVIKDLQHRFIMLNDAACSFFGVAREQLLGKGDHDFFPKEQADICISQDVLVFKTGKEFINEETLVDINGIAHNVIIRKSCFELSNSEKTLIATIEDITPLKEYEEELKKSKEAAELGSKFKSDFLANMSHEIRTPMNGVLGFLQLLEKTKLDEEQKELLIEIQKSSEMLLNIINDVLDYSKIEAGKMVVENIGFDIRDCVEDMVLLAVPNAHKKSININSIIHSNVPNRVLGDSNKLKQILNNLINNSVKFTNTGEIFIEVELDSQVGNSAIVKFKILDTGIGIPKDKIDMIFDSFSQADASATRKFGGTGLGLAIVKKLVNLMDGNIKVESVLNKGTTFTFTINLPILAPANPIDFHENLKDKKALLMINNNRLSKVIETYSNDFGILTSPAETEKDILDALNAKGDISIVITDSNNLAKKIKNTHPDLPVIFVFPIDYKNDFLKENNGFLHYYISTPIKRNKLLNVYKKALNIAVPEIKISNKNDLLESNTSISNLKILLAEDNEINQKLISKLFTKIGCYCDIVGNGAKAVEAYKNNKYDVILMDCQMPILDGYQATREIREYESNDLIPRIPIIAITANALKEDINNCLDAGMDKYIPKPINLDSLIKILKEYSNK